MGWYETEDFTGEPYVFTTMPLGNLDLYAKWVPDYKVIEGDDQVATQGEPITFRINADFSLFSGEVYLDGRKLDESEYTAFSGSTIITLSEKLSASLSEGEHTLAVAFTDGGLVEVEFHIEEADDTKTPDTSAPDTGGNQTISGSAVPTLITFMITGALLTVIFTVNIKRRKS